MARWMPSVVRPGALTLRQDFCNYSTSLRVWKETGTKPFSQRSYERPEHQAMLAAIITLGLLSLLVATEADPSSPPNDSASNEALRPPCKLRRRRDRDKTDRLAA
jgi:hypothetical protein